MRLPYIFYILSISLMAASDHVIYTTTIDAVPAVRYQMSRDPLLLIVNQDGSLVGHSLTTGVVEWTGSAGGPLVRTEVERTSDDDILGKPFVVLGDMLCTTGQSGTLQPYQHLSWLMRHPYTVANGTEVIVTTSVEKFRRSSITGQPTIHDEYVNVHLARLTMHVRVVKVGVFAWQMDIGRLIVSHQPTSMERFKSRALLSPQVSPYSRLVAQYRDAEKGEGGEVCLTLVTGTVPIWCAPSFGNPAAAVVWTDAATEAIRLEGADTTPLGRILLPNASPRNANIVDEGIFRLDEEWRDMTLGRTSTATYEMPFMSSTGPSLRHVVHALGMVAAAVMLVVGILPRPRLMREWASFDALQAELRSVSQPPSTFVAPKSSPIGTSPMTLDLQPMAQHTLEEQWLYPRAHMCVGEGVFARQFEVLKKLGGGGGGAVLAVRHSITRDCYAVKVVLMDDYERVRQEAVVHSGFHHPNVVRYHNCWTEAFTLQTLESFELFPEVESALSITSVEDKRFSRDSDTEDSMSVDLSRTVEVLLIQMEYFEGGTLAAYLSTRDVAAAANHRKNIKFLLAVATGLQYVHAKEVVHQDIKPSNIFIVGDDAKIGDFGLSTKVLDGVTGGGTPPYRSPEQAAGEAPQYSMDIYALGIVAAECFCHFTTSHERLTTLDALTSAGVIPSPIEEHCPSMGSLILEMTHKNPNCRPTAADVVAALVKIEANMT